MSKLDKVFTCSCLDTDFRPVKRSESNAELEERLKKTQKLELDLRRENTKLKELLKECLEPLEVLAEKRNACDWYPEDLLAKIDEVLK